MHDPIKEQAARIEKHFAHMRQLRRTGHLLIARARKAVGKANTVRERARQLRARIRELEGRRAASGEMV